MERRISVLWPLTFSASCCFRLFSTAATLRCCSFLLCSSIFLPLSSAQRSSCCWTRRSLSCSSSDSSAHTPGYSLFTYLETQLLLFPPQHFKGNNALLDPLYSTLRITGKPPTTCVRLPVTDEADRPHSATPAGQSLIPRIFSPSLLCSFAKCSWEPVKGKIKWLVWPPAGSTYVWYLSCFIMLL